MARASLKTHNAVAIDKITASNNELDPRPCSLYVTVNGTIDIVNEDGSIEAGIAVTAGTTIPFQPFKITGISAATVYGLYH